LYARASEFATQTGSPLAEGYIAAWKLHAELCTPEGRHSRPDWAPSRFGGPESLGWSCASSTGIVHEARNGRLAAAEALVSAGDYEYAHPLDEIGMRAIAQALADEPARGIESARLVLERADQITDTDYHAELVLAVAIAHLRTGDPQRAFTYLDALRRAPMFYPLFYDLRRDFAEQARSQLDEDTLTEARLAAQNVDVEAILDRELRAPTRPVGS
jgi:hypothetical protein